MNKCLCGADLLTADVDGKCLRCRGRYDYTGPCYDGPRKTTEELYADLLRRVKDAREFKQNNVVDYTTTDGTVRMTYAGNIPLDDFDRLLPEGK